MTQSNQTHDPIRFLSAFEHHGPIDMVNLFRFREQARYPTNLDEPMRTGREAFAVYARLLGPVLAANGSCKQIWHGAVHFDITGGGEDTWDEMMVVRYPSRDALITLLSSPIFASIHHHRAAAIKDSQTFICTSIDT